MEKNKREPNGKGNYFFFSMLFLRSITIILLVKLMVIQLYVRQTFSFLKSSSVIRRSSFQSTGNRSFDPENSSNRWIKKNTNRMIVRSPLSSSSSSAGYKQALYQDTIFALSSGPITKTGVSFIRISGKDSKYCLQKLCKPAAKMPEPRRASLRRLYCQEGNLLDQSLVLWLPGPNSFTGEDIVELHVHGSRAVILGVMGALEAIDGTTKSTISNNYKDDDNIDADNERILQIRPAERGEFTRRAFENGRMDLTEVEGLADLLAADSSEQRKQALRQMDGYLRESFEAWRQELVGCLAHTEAVIDFGDDDRENDVNDDAMWKLTPRIQDLQDTLLEHLRDGKRGEIIREGVKIALAGPPNAGKSSLMNALARRPAAIVSPIAGTTRDIVEVRMDLAGVTCIVSDTAGLRSDSVDPIEKEGMRRAKEAFAQAHIKVFVGDASDSNSLTSAYSMLESLLSSEEKNENNNINNNIIDGDEGDNEDEIDSKNGNNFSDQNNDYRVLMVLNKADLLSSQSNDIATTTTTNKLTKSSHLDKKLTSHPISCVTGEGLQELESSLTQAIQSLLAGGGGGEGVLITRERHRRHLKQCTRHLDRFLSHSLPMDAAAEELRLAMQELGKVTGRVDVEELLDIIFRDFCIGK